MVGNNKIIRQLLFLRNHLKCKNDGMIKYSLTVLGWTGWENIWLLVMALGPHCTHTMTLSQIFSQFFLSGGLTSGPTESAYNS